MAGVLDLPPWPDDAYPNRVTFHALKRNPDGTPIVTSRGTVVQDWEEVGEEFPASVQAGTVARKEPDGTIVEVAGVQILTPTDPRCHADDQVRWVTGGEVRKFAVQGRAVDEGGIGDGWTTSTQEVT